MLELKPSLNGSRHMLISINNCEFTIDKQKLNKRTKLVASMIIKNFTEHYLNE